MNNQENNENNRTEKLTKHSIISDEIIKPVDNNLERLNLDYFKLVNKLAALTEENADLKKKLQAEKTNSFINIKPNLSKIYKWSSYEFTRY